jgi:hypothetical protein
MSRSGCPSSSAESSSWRPRRSLRTLVVALIGVVAFASGLMLGYKLDADDNGAPTAATSGLPAAVEQTHAELLAAAESGDYAALAELIPTTGFEYTFGDAVEGGPVAYWQELESTTGERPIEALAAILKMPYVLSRGYYVWPWTYTVESSDDLSPHERELLAPLGVPSEFFPEGIGYLGWRAGIAPDGTWTFFVAGD